MLVVRNGAVSSAKSSAVVGLEGIVIQDTKNTIKIVTDQDSMRGIFRSGIVC